jgi:hypothetical protein
MRIISSGRAAVLEGQASRGLLGSYQKERRPIGIRNADWALHSFKNQGCSETPPFTSSQASSPAIGQPSELCLRTLRRRSAKAGGESHLHAVHRAPRPRPLRGNTRRPFSGKGAARGPFWPRLLSRSASGTTDCRTLGSRLRTERFRRTTSSAVTAIQVPLSPTSTVTRGSKRRTELRWTLFGRPCGQER